MSGFFGVISKADCVMHLFFGVDYHSHLGTRRAGISAYDPEIGLQREIHNIQNSPFRTKFDKDANEMQGNMGIGCISDFEPQPLLIQSHLGSFAISTVGKINNHDELVAKVYEEGTCHFQEMSGGMINATELVAALMCTKHSILAGIRYVQGLVKGSLSIMLLTKDGIYVARDRLGRTPVMIGKKEGAMCATFESFAYMNLEINPTSAKGAIGTQTEKIIAEYPSHRVGETHVTVFNRNNGKFMCAVMDSSGMNTNYVLKEDGNSGSALFFALMPYFLEDEEFSECYTALLKCKKDGFTDMPSAEDAAYLLCDNVYRRIEGASSLGDSGVKIRVQYNGNI